jgi:hypothetical protein
MVDAEVLGKNWGYNRQCVVGKARERRRCRCRRLRRRRRSAE